MWHCVNILQHVYFTSTHINTRSWRCLNSGASRSRVTCGDQNKLIGLTAHESLWSQCSIETLAWFRAVVIAPTHTHQRNLLSDFRSIWALAPIDLNTYRVISDRLSTCCRVVSDRFDCCSDRPKVSKHLMSNNMQCNIIILQIMVFPLYWFYPPMIFLWLYNCVRTPCAQIFICDLLSHLWHGGTPRDWPVHRRFLWRNPSRLTGKFV